MLASGSGDGTIRLWDVDTGEEKKILNGHRAGGYSVAFSPDGKMLASGSADGTIRLWDVANDEEKEILNGHTEAVFSIAFSPDGKMLATGSYDNTLRLWDVDTGEEKRILNGHTARVASVAFSPNERTLASGSWDGTVLLWNYRSVGDPFSVEPRGKKLVTLGQIKRTQLFQNYPNPFNPETWIPYRLANASTVQITIYDAHGTVVRQIDLGYQQAGEYQTRKRAAHWDGTNEIGEKVSSGIYFYQLKADNASLLRKMLILQ